MLYSKLTDKFPVLCKYTHWTKHTNKNKIKLLTNESKKFNTLRTGDADLRFYITTVQDG
jgi:hypothetical protein